MGPEQRGRDRAAPRPDAPRASRRSGRSRRHARARRRSSCSARPAEAAASASQPLRRGSRRRRRAAQPSTCCSSRRASGRCPRTSCAELWRWSTRRTLFLLPLESATATLGRAARSCSRGSCRERLASSSASRCFAESRERRARASSPRRSRRSSCDAGEALFREGRGGRRTACSSLQRPPAPRSARARRLAAHGRPGRGARRALARGAPGRARSSAVAETRRAACCGCRARAVPAPRRGRAARGLPLRRGRRSPDLAAPRPRPASTRFVAGAG